MLAGSRAVTDTIRAFVERGEGAETLASRCADEAVGAVVVYRIRPAHLADWGQYGHRWHLATLIVASAVNVDEWRASLVARGRGSDRALVYSRVLREIDGCLPR